MAMNTDKINRSRGSRTSSRFVCIAIAQVETELRVVLASGDVFVCVNRNAWRNSQLHSRSRKPLCMQRIQLVQLVEIVDNDVTNTCFNRHS